MLSNSDSSKILAGLKDLKEEIADLKDEVKDTKNDLSMEIIHLKMDLQEENKKLSRRVREVKVTLNTFIRLSDNSLQETRQRVYRIEDNLKLPSVT